MKKKTLIVITLIFALTGCAGMEANQEKTEISAEDSEADRETVNTVIQTVSIPTEASIFDTLNKLEYQPYTCDGLPEYRLTAADGTVYSINLSEKWVWRGNQEQAELTEELISQLENSAVRSSGMESAGLPIETISQTEAEEIALAGCKVKYDYTETQFDAASNAWKIEFWEDNAATAAQTITVDAAGNIVSSWFAE